MKVFRVQDTGNKVGEAGAVARGVYSDYPGEAETITLGFAPGKAYDSVGIGRQGNFMLWGWSAAPSQMTPAGQQLFLNCICYIHQFDRKPFIAIPTRAITRKQDLPMILNLIERRPENAATYLSRYFPPGLVTRFEGNLAGLRKHYDENIELVYAESNKFFLDEDLKSLGIETNRKVETIKTLIGLLADESKAPVARECLTRYTGEAFRDAAVWNRWYEQKAEHLAFSDAGGYRFYEVPDLD
ncbi:MAG: hypothetical protein JW993_15435 [Sedimentisphaerales bacterium]|nr:hypothetical protein [Sedimentisphaerales bacterium]